MPNAKGLYTIRECASDILRAIEAHGTDQQKLSASLAKAGRKLMSRPDFFQLGAKYRANHIAEAKYLYYDGELVITTATLPDGKFIPPHDHGVWEAMITVTGKLRHTVYDRADDGSREGHAELVAVDDRVLGVGDIAMVMPPAEIHSFSAVDGDSQTLVIVGGPYKPIRTYYNLDKQTYAVSAPRTQ